MAAKPNINGNSAGDISSAVRYTLDFEISTAGNYVIQFLDNTTSGGYHEFLLAECRLRDLDIVTGVTTSDMASHAPKGIYSPTGMRRGMLQRGLNIIVDANGKSHKVVIH